MGMPKPKETPDIISAIKHPSLFGSVTIHLPSPSATRRETRAVIDLIRAWAPPFDPSVVVAELSEIVKYYGIASVIGDNYAGEWPVESFRLNGMALREKRKNKSELYLQLVPTVNPSRLTWLDIAS
jgi:hypothetical protein